MTGVVYTICIKVDGRKKVIISKGDNLEKHEEKRVYEEVGISYMDLEVGNIFTKRNYKQLKNQVF